MNKRDITVLVKRINNRMKEVATIRDKLNADIVQFNMLRDDCEKAYDALQDARDALSELV